MIGWIMSDVVDNKSQIRYTLIIKVKVGEAFE